MKRGGPEHDCSSRAPLAAHACLLRCQAEACTQHMQRRLPAQMCPLRYMQASLLHRIQHKTNVLLYPGASSIESSCLREITTFRLATKSRLKFVCLHAFAMIRQCSARSNYFASCDFSRDANAYQRGEAHPSQCMYKPQCHGTSVSRYIYQAQ